MFIFKLEKTTNNNTKTCTTLALLMKNYHDTTWEYIHYIVLSCCYFYQTLNVTYRI